MRRAEIKPFNSLKSRVPYSKSNFAVTFPSVIRSGFCGGVMQNEAIVVELIITVRRFRHGRRARDTRFTIPLYVSKLLHYSGSSERTP